MATPAGSTKDLIKSLREMQEIAKQSSGGGLLDKIFGSGPPKEVTQRLHDIRSELTARAASGDSQAETALIAEKGAEQGSKHQAFLSNMRDAGKAAMAGPLAPGKGYDFSGSANTLGSLYKAGGEKIGGPGGEGLKIAAAILQIVGKLDEWGKAQLQGTFARFRDTSPTMQFMEMEFQRRSAQIEGGVGETLAPFQQMHMEASLERQKAQRPMEEFIGGAKSLFGTFTDKALGKVEGIAGWGFDMIKGIATGKTMDQIEKEREEAGKNAQTMDLTEFSQMDEWTEFVGLPKDFQ